jgi:hypothetical protein
MTYRLIYVSRVARQVRFSDVEAIAEAASRRNAQDDISGLLLYMPSHFVQVLEGEREKVLATYRRIGEDPRHQALRVVFEGEERERRFGAWGMTARLAPAGLKAQDIERLSGVDLEKILLASTG